MNLLLVNIPDACRMLGCGRTYLYSLAARKQVRLVKLGRATRVPVADLNKLVADLTGDDAANPE